MDDDSSQLSALIGDVYDAALDPALWSNVLEVTCGFVGGLWCNLFTQDSVQMKSPFFVNWGVDPSYERLYLQTYVKLNPMTVPSVLYAHVGSVLTVSDLIPENEFRDSRFYREWLMPQRIVDSIAAVLDKSPTSYAAVSLSRHVRHGPVDDETRRRMKLLAPHFHRAVAIGKIIDLHKVEAAAFADALDGLATGFFLVDANGRIVHANAPGHAMLADGSVVRAAAGKLAAVDLTANRALNEVFMNAPEGDAAVGVKGISVPLAAGAGERYIAHVLPLTSGARRKAGLAYSAVAAVFVRKAALDLPHPLDTLANAYKLTPAEMRVLMMIVQLGGVPEVAPVLGMARPTVKTHLQHIFDKTDTKRQSDLVKLVAGYMTPLS
jgi:DNA-binding CsgD family transcriptional regulator